MDHAILSAPSLETRCSPNSLVGARTPREWIPFLSPVVRRQVPIHRGALIGWSVLQGGFVFALVTAIFVTGHRQGMRETEVRALAFFSLVMTIIGLIFVNRSFSASLITAVRRPNPALVWVLISVTAMLGLTLHWRFASGLFRFGPRPYVTGDGIFPKPVIASAQQAAIGYKLAVDCDESSRRRMMVRHMSGWRGASCDQLYPASCSASAARPIASTPCGSGTRSTPA